MKILLTGPRGFVGQRIYNRYKDITVPAPSLQGMPLDEIRRVIDRSGADVIIHTAAISDTGYCQTHPEESYQANVILPSLLAEAANGRKLICFSSDQVYNGCESEGPYKEEDACPASVYADHKLEMENRVLDICPDAVMLRAEWMYDHDAERSNYFCNMMKAEKSVAFSSAQYRGVTYVKEVADAMVNVIKFPGGAYNFGSETTMNMVQITDEFLRLAGKDIIIEEGPARHNLWMDCSKARAYGVDFSDVITGLEKCYHDMLAVK